ncbi:CAMK family protein kinase [Trichomonas vaginalis G3]|uniref:CAMK family protein kinase n=1 Tax=Trichomonas vaginalis (strain ATCC PRA-98 / G3) TaxID=412133 RepID=A2F567_TRIV3|nr:protein localization to meiotic spindle midzone [Trichomonas vaginalis G3]EAX99960.1 CAMK family protein kinase [Trichomonas vaginalis G3]KAI5516725.1 protein localization to meiotic spindle midzone [Trichomonas vaginalis G3]|eukprot:XP_001312890.1 CAMK family protein kinase [Trichomonas vaginalis G3]
MLPKTRKPLASLPASQMNVPRDLNSKMKLSSKIDKTTSSSSSASSNEGNEINEKVKKPKLNFLQVTHHRAVVKVNGNVYYHIDKEPIGAGGTSKVYKVANAHGEEFALKVVDYSNAEDKTIVETYRKEIEILEQFKGEDKIIQLIDSEINESKQKIYLVQELGDEDLKKFMESCPNDKFDIQLIQKIWFEILSSVKVVHDKSYCHTDLKPENFLFVNGRLKLIDFGIAEKVNIHEDTTRVTRTNAVGTLNYMAPETLDPQNRKVGRTTDVWALGCILYRLVYHKMPFPQSKPELKILAITGGMPYEVVYDSIGYDEDPPELPLIQHIIQQCLQRDPKLRPEIHELLNEPLIPLPESAEPTKEQNESEMEMIPGEPEDITPEEKLNDVDSVISHDESDSHHEIIESAHEIIDYNDPEFVNYRRFPGYFIFQFLLEFINFIQENVSSQPTMENVFSSLHISKLIEDYHIEEISSKFSIADFKSRLLHLADQIFNDYSDDDFNSQNTGHTIVSYLTKMFCKNQEFDVNSALRKWSYYHQN